MGTRRTEICEEFAARLRSGGAAAFAAHLDLADPLSIDRFVESADYLIGAVDVLVSAAGLADGSWVGRATPCGTSRSADDRQRAR